MRTIGFILCLFFGTSISLAQEKLLSAKDIKKDLDVFVDFLTAHPNPYRFNEKESFDALISEIREESKNGMLSLDFCKSLKEIMALLKDGHSSVSMGREWYEKSRKAYGVTPLRFFMDQNDQLFLLRDLSDSGKIPLGAQVLEINDVPIEQLVEDWDKYLGYETKTFRNVIFPGNISDLLYLQFGNYSSVKIKYKHLKEETVDVENVDLKVLEKKWKEIRKKKQEEEDVKRDKNKPYYFKDLGDGIGYLRILSFSVPDINEYGSFLRKTFKKLRKEKCHSLVIDVRGNFGGWPKVSSKLLHYLTQGHFKTMAMTKAKASAPYKDQFRVIQRYDNNPFGTVFFNHQRHLIDIEGILNAKKDAMMVETSFYNEPPEKMKWEFEGTPYLLIDRKSYSAASSFAATFQCYDLGLIIGEETGGTRIFHANPISIKLPKSEIFARISTTEMLTTCGTDELSGITPHIKSTPSLLDRIHETDSVLNHTKRIIKKVRQKVATENN